VHPVTKKVDVNGQMRCKDVFIKYVTKGDNILEGRVISKIFQPLFPDQTTIECSMLKSINTNPRYTTDLGCFHTGIVTISLPPHTPGQTTYIEETMIFGEDSIIFRTTHLGTGRILEIQCHS
jgi:hypothetical protein